MKFEFQLHFELLSLSDRFRKREKLKPAPKNTSYDAHFSGLLVIAVERDFLNVVDIFLLIKRIVEFS